MACTPVKRVLDLDSLFNTPDRRPVKRPKYTANHEADSQVDTPPVSDCRLTPTKMSSGASPFREVTKKIPSDKMAETIKEEMHQISRKRNLSFSSCGPTTGLANPAPDKADKPLFTYSQISLICEKMLREQEQRIREEYERVLSEKLAEQYDTFVKFTYDQIQKKFKETPPSYMS